MCEINCGQYYVCIKTKKKKSQQNRKHFQTRWLYACGSSAGTWRVTTAIKNHLKLKPEFEVESYINA